MTDPSRRHQDAQGDGDDRVRKKGQRAALLIAEVTPIAMSCVALIAMLIRPGSPDSLTSLTIAFGDWVPTWLLVDIVLAIVGYVALLAAILLAGPMSPRPWRASRVVLAAALILAVPASLVCVALSTSSRYSVLPGESADGCRVVVRESTFVVTSWGDVGILEPGSMIVDWRGQYSAKDAYMPFSAGTYSLEWDGNRAEIDLWATESQPASWSEVEPKLACTG
ncbi:hypothetical protein [Paramicrobacterium agarici]|uniref:hypothetical protein n=1 Tax=Paramicrobacterium agarici TaxID=630514 RepID=UPI00117C3145|nr:hypothetical protein [Microbacterium agarici]